MAEPAELVCEAGGWRLEVVPELGGSVQALSWNHLPVLVSDPARSDPVLAMACFPMVPFANRVRDGLVSVPDGPPVRIEGYGVADPVHPLHGVGWRRPWRVEEQTKPSGIQLRLEHPGDAHWPWPFEAWLSYSLTEAAFSSVLMLVNTADTPMPASIGLHPWFPAPKARITLDAATLWTADPFGVCSVAQPHGGFTDQSVSELSLDDCFTGSTGHALVSLHGLDFEVFARTPSGAEHRHGDAWHLYAPQGGPRFCLEPQTARSGAFDLKPGTPGGPAWLLPGAEDLVVALTIMTPEPPAPEGARRA